MFFRKVLEMHEHDEDAFVFPPVGDRLQYVADPYSFDHQRHVALYGKIEGTFTTLREGTAVAKKESARDLTRHGIALNVMMDIHISKENELLIPAFERHFSPEEAAAIEQEMFAAIPQELMMEILPWMFVAQTVDDREGTLHMGQEAFPPAQFEGMASLLSSTVSADDWAEMVRRVPELSSLS